MDAKQTGVKVLLLSSRNPRPAYTGDRVRATMWIGALERFAEVTVVAPGAYGARFSVPRLVGAAASAFFRGLPWHSALAGAYDWRGAIARATAARGPFDATVVLLSRFDPWVREAIGGRRILDAIDSLRRSMAERERQSGPLLRWLWRAEERRTARLEREAGARYERVVITNAEDLNEFGGATTVVPMGVPIAPAGDAPRPFDFGFWGNLSYFANADSVRVLVRELWPSIRERHPRATLVLAGARAPREVLRLDGRDGVTVLSPVEDMPALARKVKIALFPIRFGTGVATKVLEAAEAGCALATTRTGVRGLALIAARALVEQDVPQLAHAAAALLDDDARRAAMGAELRDVVAAHYSRTQAMEQLAAIALPPEVRP